MQTILLTYASIPELGLCATEELEVIQALPSSVPDSATTSPPYSEKNGQGHKDWSHTEPVPQWQNSGLKWRY